jgi:type III secretory pathway component EscS
VVALAAGSYVLVPSAPPVVAAIFGVLLVYGQAFTDISDFDLAEDNGFKTFAFAVFLFVVIITAIGWALPPARTVVPVVAGIGAVVAYAGLFAAIAVTSIFVDGLSGLDEGGETSAPSYDGDVYTTFAFAAVLVIGWLVLGYLTDSPGYRVVIVAMVATVFPAGLALLAVEHPTAWAVVVAALGTLVLGVAGVRVVSRRSETATFTPN